MNESNMYPWVTATRNYVGGECPHKCHYCFVNDLKKYPNVAKRYSGEPFLIESELAKNEGGGKTVFVQDCGDLFAEAIPIEWINRVFLHCNAYPGNIYVFQTKNPKRFMGDFVFPKRILFGTTLESNIDHNVTEAPTPNERFEAMMQVKEFVKKRNLNADIFISIEPVMDFDLATFSSWIYQLKPKFVSIGADSKRCGLTEPSAEKVRLFINEMRNVTEVRVKDNLKRLVD